MNLRANIEIKARISHFARLKKRAKELSQRAAMVLDQEDTFFCTPKGRLKLRIFAPRRGELIYYERADIAGPKRSEYALFSTEDPDALRTTLALALGVQGIIRKKRRLYMLGHTRLHLDTVQGLGDFVELEVVLQPGQTTEEGIQIAHDLMQRLDIAPEDLIQGSYLDLAQSYRQKGE